MKLLFDQNISRRLVNQLKELYPGSNHVYPLGLFEATDDEVWKYARNNSFLIVSQLPLTIPDRYGYDNLTVSRNPLASGM